MFIHARNTGCTAISKTACVSSAPQQSEASQDFLKSCSADEVSCTAETETATVEEGTALLLTEGRSVILISVGSQVTANPMQHSYISDIVCVSDEDNVERACDTLLMCIVTVLNHGLRNGGGVGDVLRKPSKDVNMTSHPSH